MVRISEALGRAADAAKLARTECWELRFGSAEAMRAFVKALENDLSMPAGELRRDGKWPMYDGIVMMVADDGFAALRAAAATPGPIPTLELVEKLSLHDRFRLLEIAHETKDSDIKRMALDLLRA